MKVEADQAAFWFVVVDCLVKFHGLDYEQAQQKVRKLRATLRKGSPAREMGDGDLIYHEEPFYVACDLQGKALNLAEFREKYDSITSQHGW